MPRSPKGETGAIVEDQSDDDIGKNPAAVALGAMGGKARANGLSATERSAIAKQPPIALENTRGIKTLMV